MLLRFTLMLFVFFTDGLVYQEQTEVFRNSVILMFLFLGSLGCGNLKGGIFCNGEDGL